MNPMWALKKGTSMKDKKKRAGGGSPPAPTGVFPTNSFSPAHLGVVSFTEMNQGSGNAFTNNQTMASVFVRDTVKIDPITGLHSFAQATNGAGANINTSGQPEIVVADYVATVLQSITPPTTQANTGFPHLNSVTMEPGTIYVSTNNFQEIVVLRYIVAGYNQQYAYNGGHPAAAAADSVVANASSIPVNSVSPLNVGGNPMQSQTGMIEFDTTAISSQAEVILEFTMTGGAKGQPVLTTATTNPVAGALFVGSCYMKVVFIA